MVDPAAQTTMMVRWLDRMRAGMSRQRADPRLQGRLDLLARKMVGLDRRVAAGSTPRTCSRTHCSACFAPWRASGRTRHGRSSASPPSRCGANCSTWPATTTAPRDWGRTTERRTTARRKPPGLDPPAPETNANDLERWSRFHEEVERLPVASGNWWASSFTTGGPRPRWPNCFRRRADDPTLVGIGVGETPYRFLKDGGAGDEP